ncbi:hypothetical protein TeGR_g9651 [Tetraparma gracilis]|uniref:GST C-terminal domain-containing protein n=1 Tax=Tetraparma gracilis TaxID=2962635 RepID=A0ABQ6MBS0_9STRA|nr:hypothetical protein TeGR_g9651 [Tetraparma gracilis]
MANSPPPPPPSAWTVYYHGGFSGRAQPLHLMLVDSGTPYTTGNKAEALALSDSTFALPAARSPSGMILGQTTAIAAWMGDEVAGGRYAVGARHVAMKVACDIADIWSEGYSQRCNYRDAPTKETAAAAAEWLSPAPTGERNSGRFLRFLRVIEASRALAAAAPSDAYLFGDKVSYVDFLLLNVIKTMEWIFGADKVDACLSQIPDLKRVVETVAKRPRVAEYLTGDSVLYESVMSEKIEW